MNKFYKVVKYKSITDNFQRIKYKLLEIKLLALFLKLKWVICMNIDIKFCLAIIRKIFPNKF